MAGSDDDAVGAPGIGRRASRVVAQDGMRDDRGRREAEAGLNAGLDTVGRQHFHRAGKGGFRQGMGIHADEQRPRDTGLLAILHQGLGHRQNMGFGKGAVQGAATVAGGTEGNPLGNTSAQSTVTVTIDTIAPAAPQAALASGSDMDAERAALMQSLEETPR